MKRILLTMPDGQEFESTFIYPFKDATMEKKVRSMEKLFPPDSDIKITFETIDRFPKGVIYPGKNNVNENTVLKAEQAWLDWERELSSYNDDLI